MIALTNAWGLSREPFDQDVPVKDLYPLPGLAPFIDRFDYAVAHGLSTVITGDVGSGKSTSLRAVAARLHPTQYRVIALVATTGSLMELLRQICLALGDPPMSNSIAKMLALVRSLLSDIVATKQIPVLIIDEAHLLRLDVFDQLHTVAQADFDSRTLVPIILAGQIALIDSSFSTARGPSPLASSAAATWRHSSAITWPTTSPTISPSLAARCLSSERMPSRLFTKAPAACSAVQATSPAAPSWLQPSNIAPSRPRSMSA